MPTTVVGLVLFVAFLTPGLLHYTQRRTLVPTGELSPLVETSTLIAISLATNLAALAMFGVLRSMTPEHTPDVGSLLRGPGEYVEDRFAYVVAWGAGLLALSCGLAIVAARWGWFRRTIVRAFAPVIVNEPAWFHVFETTPQIPDGAPAYIYVGCDLKDGSYIAGRLAWYSTETSETADRDLVLAAPISRKVGGKAFEVPGFERVILSAREVQRLYVTWVAEG